jgi:cytochrome oxidase Cu insertion factor (SCO1/SenC/PrrC family)
MNNRFFIILVLSIQLASCFSAPTLKTGREGRPIPSFDVMLTDGSHFSTDSIKKGHPVVFVLFRTTCPACNAETKNIIDHIRDVQDIQFYFVTMDTLADLKRFVSNYHFEKYPNLIAAKDYSKYFIHYFTVPAVPYIAVFNSDKKLKRVFLGNYDMQEIREVSMQ